MFMAMTSRRSRLKAVANLPVRRKTSCLATNISEVLLSDTEALENASSSNLNGAEIINHNGLQYEECPTQIIKNLKDSQNSSNYKLNLLSCSDNDDNLNNICLNNINGSNAKDNLVNCNTSNLNCILSDINDVNSIKASEVNKSDLFSSCFGENSQLRSLNQNSVTLNIEKSKSDNVSDYLNNNNINNINSDTIKFSQESNVFNKETEISDNNKELNINSINENVDILKSNFKYFTVLPSQNVIDPSVSTYTISTLTPCEINNVETDSDPFSSHQCQEFEEVQIYTELLEPTGFYGNLQEVLSEEVNENNEKIIELEQSKPTFTTLVNCSLKDQIKLNTSSGCNETNLSSSKNIPQNAFLKSTSTSPIKHKKFNNVLKNEEYSRILGESNTGSPPDITLEYEAFDSSSKTSITPIKRKRSKCNDLTKKLADAKREFQKKFERVRPNRSTLKMIDLIFYNPTTNPMESKTKFEKKDVLQQEGLIQEILAEEKVDEPEPVNFNLASKNVNNTDIENINKMPVPQVKVGLNGEIILDEKSLVIETTEAKKGREDLQNSTPIFEDRISKASYYKGKTKKTKDWNDFETKRFYKALNTIGPDFSLMQKYFPKRSRLELKNKFKREERLNRQLIDKALNNPSEFDMTLLEKDLAVEKKAEEEEAELKLKRKIKIKKKVKQLKLKSSILSREIVESDCDSNNFQFEASVSNSRRISHCEKEKKKHEINFIFQKLLNKDSNV